MSYDIDLVDAVTGEVLEFSEPVELGGGTYPMGGTKEMSFNITYNYSKHFTRVLGEGGIRSLYGKMAVLTIPILNEAINQLGDDVSDDYWEATEGNAKNALKILLIIAEHAPVGVWKGD